MAADRLLNGNLKFGLQAFIYDLFSASQLYQVFTSCGRFSERNCQRCDENSFPLSLFVERLGPSVIHLTSCIDLYHASTHSNSCFPCSELSVLLQPFEAMSISRTAPWFVNVWRP